MNWTVKGKREEQDVTLTIVGGPNTEAEARDYVKATSPDVNATSFEPASVGDAAQAVAKVASQTKSGKEPK